MSAVTGDDQGQESGEEAKAPDGESAPTLEPADRPDETEKKRPSWFDVPRTIKKSFMQGDTKAPLFGFHLEGGAVSKQGVQIGFLASFLEEFRKVFAPLQVVSTGQIPQGNRLPAISAGELDVLALTAKASVTIFFSLDPDESQVIEKRPSPEAAQSLITVRAVGHLGALLSLDPDEVNLRRAIGPFGRRVGRSYGGLADLLGESGVGADWWSDLYRDASVEVPALKSQEIADELLHKAIVEEIEISTEGFMWGATTASNRRSVRINLGNRSITATYDIPLTARVTKALSHLVRVRLRETTYRFPFAEEPHRREWELLKILRVGEPAGALKEAAQQRLI